jgi:hypothetical protein
LGIANHLLTEANRQMPLLESPAIQSQNPTL